MSQSSERLTTDDLSSSRLAPDGGTADTAPADTVPEAPGAAAGNEPLLTDEEAAEFRRLWEQVQTAFVDEPRRAVEDADALVARVMQRLADVFAGERADLEAQWDRGEDVDTEALRVTLQRYRSFFNRLLTT